MSFKKTAACRFGKVHFLGVGLFFSDEVKRCRHHLREERHWSHQTDQRKHGAVHLHETASQTAAPLRSRMVFAASIWACPVIIKTCLAPSSVSHLLVASCDYMYIKCVTCRAQSALCFEVSPKSSIIQEADCIRWKFTYVWVVSVSIRSLKTWSQVGIFLLQQINHIDDSSSSSCLARIRWICCT